MNDGPNPNPSLQVLSPAGLALFALPALLLAGCASSSGPATFPVVVPIRTPHARRSGQNEVLVALPNRGVVSLRLHYFVWSGRMAITRLAVINQTPDHVTVHAPAARVYVDADAPLRLDALAAFKPKESALDKRLLRPYPENAKASWLIFRLRFLTPDGLRGPMIVLPYEVYGEEGFVKIPYRTLWNVDG
jgi:hypothetical protein